MQRRTLLKRGTAALATAALPVALTRSAVLKSLGHQTPPCAVRLLAPDEASPFPTEPTT